MSVLDAPELVPVPVNYCPCAGKPHPDGDIVYLHPELSMSGGMAATAAISEGADSIRLQELLARVWIAHGVAAWTFLDDEGQPIPVTPDNVILALPYAKGGRLVAEKADDIYAKAVVDPLLERLRLANLAADRSRKQSRLGSTRSSRLGTSPGKTSRGKRPSPSSTPATAKVRLDA